MPRKCAPRRRPVRLAEKPLHSLAHAPPAAHTNLNQTTPLKPTLPHPRSQRRTWLYRIRPSVTHEPFHPLNFPAETLTADFASGVVTPNQLRWRPWTIPAEPVDFVRGMFTVCGAGRCGRGPGLSTTAALAGLLSALSSARRRLGL